MVASKVVDGVIIVVTLWLGISVIAPPTVTAPATIIRVIPPISIRTSLLKIGENPPRGGCSFDAEPMIYRGSIRGFEISGGACRVADGRGVFTFASFCPCARIRLCSIQNKDPVL